MGCYCLLVSRFCVCLLGVSLLVSPVRSSFAQETAVPAAARSQTSQAPLASAFPSYVTAPLLFTDVSGSPAIKVLLNNKTEAYFLLDTASNSTSVTRAMAASLGLKPIPVKPDRKTASGTSGRFEYVSLDSLRFDRFDYDADCIVRDMDFGSINGKPVGGFIGTNIFKDFAVMLDFEKNQMILVPGGKLTDTQRDALGFARTTQVVDVLLGSSDSLRVPVQIGTIPKPLAVSCAISTASLRTLVSQAVKINAPILLERSIENGSSRSFFTVRKIASVQVGATSIAPFMCGFAKLPPSDSVLGMDFLAQCRVLLDYPAANVYITRTSGDIGDIMFPTIASRKNAAQTLFGVGCEPNAVGEWHVTDVDFGVSFAALGLQVGDIVREVNGIKTDGLSNDVLAAAFDRARITKVLKLRVLRDGKLVEIVGDVKVVEGKK